MTTRTELLDLIATMLTERIGHPKVGRRDDGVIIVAGDTEAFAVQALTIDAPEEADPLSFGEDLVEFIRSRSAPANNNRATRASEPPNEYTAIDGDISDYFDAQEGAVEYSTDELRQFLTNVGHSMSDAINAIMVWQQGRFDAIDPSWDRFKLSPLGLAVVKELRARQTERSSTD